MEIVQHRGFKRIPFGKTKKKQFLNQVAILFTKLGIAAAAAAAAYFVECQSDNSHTVYPIFNFQKIKMTSRLSW